MNDETFMKEAIKDAKENGHLFGAVIVKEKKIISYGGKRPPGDARYHAETQAILNAGKNLDGSTLYSTCEPCPMCFYMAWTTGISKIVYGVTIQDSIKEGINEIDISVQELNKKSGRKIQLEAGILREECFELLKGHFAQNYP